MLVLLALVVDDVGEALDTTSLLVGLNNRLLLLDRVLLGEPSQDLPQVGVFFVDLVELSLNLLRSHVFESVVLILLLLLLFSLLLLVFHQLLVQLFARLLVLLLEICVLIDVDLEGLLLGLHNGLSGFAIGFVLLKVLLDFPLAVLEHLPVDGLAEVVAQSLDLSILFLIEFFL